MSNIKWTCTDPDNGQYGRQLSEHVYEFKERGHRAEINLKDYTKDEIQAVIISYGYTLYESQPGLANIISEYGGDGSRWIIAECIFETELV